MASPASAKGLCKEMWIFKKMRAASAKLVARPRSLATLAAHEPVEGLEIRPGAALREERSTVHDRKFSATAVATN
jgi:hypothetical protein